MAMADIILWRRLDLPGHEVGRLEFRDAAWELSGTALFAHEQQPCKLEYRIRCDSAWRTRSAWIGGMIADRAVDLEVLVDADQRWQVNGVECRAVAGCIDIDLGFSPSTNVLPIRRLSLAIGGQAEVRTAWLPFPSLVFEVLPQLYRREGERTYRYESGGGAFVRTLEVNAVGMVTDYPGLWRMEAVA